LLRKLLSQELVLFVTSAERPFSESERAFMERIRIEQELLATQEALRSLCARVRRL